MLEIRGTDKLGADMMPWRRLVRWVARVADKAILVAALLTWWFLLRPDAQVVDAVDTVSYLVTVYSVWRAARALAVRSRSVRLRVRRREVAEAGQDGRDRAVAQLGSQPPEGVSQGGVVDDEHVGRS